jgi:hypothetical protein
MSKKHTVRNAMIRCNIILWILLLLLTEIQLFAQATAKERPGLKWITGLTIDGNLDDWQDSLEYVYKNQHLQYSVGNDGENLYIAMRVPDMDKQMQALTQGFSFMINTAGKKREGPAVIFPIPDRESLRAVMSRENENRPEDMRKGLMQAVRAIYVLRFDDIVDGQISRQNQYGIQAEIQIDSTDALCFEAAIPLQRLSLDIDHAGEIAMNVKINGLIMPSRGGSGLSPMGRRGYPYGGYGYGYPYGYGYGQPTRSQPRQEPGVWITDKLTTQP